MRTSWVVAFLVSGLLLTACGGGGSSSGGSAPATAGTQIAISFYGGVTPLAVADQIGAGAWTTTTLSGGRLVLTVPTGTTQYAVAFVCPAVNAFGTVNPEQVIEATTSDPTSYTVSCYGTLSTGTVTGSVNAAAIPGAANVEVRGAAGYGSNVTGTSGTFSASLPTGANDIAAVAVDSSNNVLGVKIVRNQTSPGTANGGNPITLAATDATATQTVTVNNIGSGYNASPAISASYYTAGGTYFLVGNNSASYAAVPAGEAAAGDWYSYESNDANTTTHELVGITQNTTSGGGAVTLTLPNPWAFTAPTAAVFPSFTMNYTGFTGDSTIDESAQIAWSISATAQVSITVYATSAYQGASTTLAIPNLTALTGFFASAPAATTVYWTMDVYGGNSHAFSAIPVSNGSEGFVQGTGSYTEP